MSDNKERFAQILFDVMGSQQLPTSERAEFISFFNSYCRAVSMQQNANSIVKFLTTNPQIKYFNFGVGHESNDEGGSYQCIDGLYIFNQEDEEFDDFHDDLYDILSDETIMDMFLNQKVSLTTIPIIFKKNLSVLESKALDMVDNFERNKLEAVIPRADNKKQAKI